MMRPHSKYQNCNYILKKCVTLCTVFAIVTITISVFMFFATCMVKSPGNIQIIYIQRDVPSPFMTDKKFLSIALDTSVIAEGFKHFNLSDDKLIKRVKYLSPGYIRFGGNAADKLYFDSNGSDPDVLVQDFYSRNYCSETFDWIKAPNFTMTGSQWLQLTKFARNTNMDMFFDLNALIRFRNGSWDYRNAEELIKFSYDHQIFVNWELGNEPNAFKHKFNEAVNASQLAKDFSTLRNILNKYSKYRTSLLVGPDVTRPLENHKESQLYLREFLESGGGKIVDSITWHQYYLNGRTATKSDFLNPGTFDLLQSQILRAKDIVNTYNMSEKPLWLGETSSAYGGGAPNLSNTFVGSFLWIDKLGLAAKLGIKVVMRQSIFQGYYALLDDNFEPNPDWWISIIYKNLIGRRTVSYYTATAPKTRFYVHCTRATLFEEFPYSVTIFGMNLNNKNTKVRIEGLYPQNYEENTSGYAFELTYDKTLTSQGVLLNGKLLRMLPDNTLPSVTPKVIYVKPFVTMPPFSIVFWVIPHTHIKACS